MRVGFVGLGRMGANMVRPFILTRLHSRQDHSSGAKVLVATRNQSGGHGVKAA